MQYGGMHDGERVCSARRDKGRGQENEAGGGGTKKAPLLVWSKSFLSNDRGHDLKNPAGECATRSMHIAYLVLCAFPFPLFESVAPKIKQKVLLGATRESA